MLGIVSDTDDDGALAAAAASEGRSRSRKAPSGSTSTGGKSGSRATGGTLGMSAADRNKIISHLARKHDPPILEPKKQLAKVNEVLKLEGTNLLPALTRLTAEQGVEVFRVLGIPLSDTPAPEGDATNA
jgi:hypothetical protein